MKRTLCQIESENVRKKLKPCIIYEGWGGRTRWSQTNIAFSDPPFEGFLFTRSANIYRGDHQSLWKLESRETQKQCIELYQFMSFVWQIFHAMADSVIRVCVQCKYQYFLRASPLKDHARGFLCCWEISLNIALNLLETCKILVFSKWPEVR